MSSTFYTLYFGPGRDFCAEAIWLFVDLDIFQGGSTVEERVAVTTLRVRTLLWAWYKRRRETHRGEDITELQDLQACWVSRLAAS